MFLACHFPCFHFSFTILILELVARARLCVRVLTFKFHLPLKNSAYYMHAAFLCGKLNSPMYSNSCTMNPTLSACPPTNTQSQTFLLLRQAKSCKTQAPPPHPWVTCRRILDTMYHDLSPLFVFDLLSALIPPLSDQLHHFLYVLSDFPTFRKASIIMQRLI